MIGFTVLALAGLQAADLRSATMVTAPICPLSAAWGIDTGQYPADREVGRVTLISNRVKVEASPTDRDLLPVYAAALARREPRPILLFFHIDTDCEEVRHVAALMEKSGRCKPDVCFVARTNQGEVWDRPRDALSSSSPGSIGGAIVPASPLGRESWLSDGDYPRDAFNAHSEGTVYFQLAVDALGKVSGCEVLRSSGNATLDNQTCSLLSRRAGFQPARNSQGIAVPWMHIDRVRWNIPYQDERVRLSSWENVTRLQVDRRGLISQCEREAPVFELRSGLQCGQLRKVSGPLRQKGSASVVEVRQSHIVEGFPLDSKEAAQENPIFLRKVRYSVGTSGQVTSCRVLSEIGSDPLKLLPPFDCHPGFDYPPNVARDTRPIAITMTYSIVRRGAQ